MTFKLTIELGNDAMQTGTDVAQALIELAERLPEGLILPGPNTIARSQGIMDANGNNVGTWKVTK